MVAIWPTVQKHLTGKALYFSHGFGITFNEQTGIIPPKDVDYSLLRQKVQEPAPHVFTGRGLNSWQIFPVYGRAKDRVIALGIAVGSGYLFETDFRKEVYSNLMNAELLMGMYRNFCAI